MSEPKSFHMSPEEFRRQGHAVVDWIADYHSRIESFPVLSRVQPGEIRSKLPPSAPEHGEAFEQILGDIERVILPGITHWQSPNFYAYFPANASGPAILGEVEEPTLDAFDYLDGAPDRDGEDDDGSK